ncbi:DNA-binding domain-containing protein [Pseudomonas sp. GD03842]|uniref:DNA-binding domain-containing protein n=1 Tax=Pseudomonas sp. GD03842 TaxID=2975385 RepID=UPI00244A9B80|nr:DNA-binding domain-containing protein [Pseudomonas sp. GD03842]MDH0744927.1 DNA-binding domain-containing protein [Pseudomonas sp. GD03842]
MSLRDFQDLFVEALYRPEATGMSDLTRQPGFTVYRNTVIKGAVDALLANFPTVERLVGREWMVAAATLYAQQSPPRDARLIFHGEGFADFLDRFEHARALPYLGNVARLDWLWTQCHTAVDEPGLDLERIARLPPDRLADLHLKPRVAARWGWYADQPVFSIWRLNREGSAMPQSLPWQGEGALLVRSAGVVGWHPLDAGGCAFLDACAAGQSLAHAARCGSDIQPSLDVLDLLTQLARADVFAEAVLHPAHGAAHGHAAH